MEKLPEWAHDNFLIANAVKGGEEVIRVEPKSYYARGRGAIAQVINGVDMAYGDLSVLNIEDSVDDGVDLLKFQIRLAGTSLYSVSNGEEFEVQDYSANALMQPKGISKTIKSFVGDREISVTLFCDLPKMIARLQLTPQDLPPPLFENFEGRKKEFFYVAMPLSTDMLHAAKTLLAFDDKAQTGSLFIEAKGLELLYYFLQGIRHVVTNDSQALRLSKSEINRIHEARTELEKRIPDHISIIDLAHSLAMNESKLAAGFKHLFGVTMSDYRKGVRMEKARDLLLNTDMNVTQVAMEVSYEYQSNFSNAFKRHFGLTPKEVRNSRF
jgi:AraC-like DNA-binding protein